MMCRSSCPCACHQIGCGCHQVEASRAATATKQQLPTAQCQACKGQAVMQSLRSVTGQVVIVICCPRCDRTKAATS